MPLCLWSLFLLLLRTPRRRLRFAGAERGSRVSQIILDPFCERVRATHHTARDPFNFLERRHAFAQIVKRGGGVLEDLASFTNALRWALYSWGDDGERANVFFADFAKDGYQAKGYFGFVDECGDYSPWGHTWAVGTRAELDAAGWAEEAFPNEDAADY